MKYIVLLRTATGATRFLVSGTKFSPEFPDAGTFDTVSQARKAAKTSGMFGLEIHNRETYGQADDSLVAVSS